MWAQDGRAASPAPSTASFDLSQMYPCSFASAVKNSPLEFFYRYNGFQTRIQLVEEESNNKVLAVSYAGFVGGKFAAEFAKFWLEHASATSDSIPSSLQ